jgi:hypothetical protein
MEALDAYALYKGLAGDDLCFAYSGEFHDQHTGRLIDIGEAAMEGNTSARGARQRLAYVMVEAYQNIIRHRARLPEELARAHGRSLFLLRSHGEAQHVIAMNPVPVSERAELERALAGLEGLDPVSLKERFLNKLSQEGMGERGGAGLGLIEMARRSGQDLKHRITALDKDHLLFVLQVSFGRHPSQDEGIAFSSELHRTVTLHDILFLHMGPRMAAISQALVQLAERDLDELGHMAVERKRALLAASEVLDKLAGPGVRCLTVMGRSGDRYRLVVGLPLTLERGLGMGLLVDAVNALDGTARTARYRALVLGRDGAGDAMELALVELARTASEPLEWTVTSADGSHFGALSVTI